MRQQPACEGKEVGGDPDGEADKENCREDPDKRSGHTAAAAHDCTLNMQRLTLRLVELGARGQGTS